MPEQNNRREEVMSEAKIRRKASKAISALIIVAVITVIIAGINFILPNLIISSNTGSRKGGGYSAEELKVIEDLFGINLSDSDEILSLYASYLRDPSAVLVVKVGGSSAKFIRDKAYERDSIGGSCYNLAGELVNGSSRYVKESGRLFPDEIVFYSEGGDSCAYCRISLDGEAIDKMRGILE